MHVVCCRSVIGHNLRGSCSQDTDTPLIRRLGPDGESRSSGNDGGKLGSRGPGLSDLTRHDTKILSLNGPVETRPRQNRDSPPGEESERES